PFSDRGAVVAAPGVGILSTTAPGRYERYDGTSMAAPHVAGLAALLWAVHPEATLAQVRKAILASAIPIRGVQNGRIHASRAPARVSVRIDPQKLATGTHQGHVTFTAEGGSAVRLTVTAQVGDAPALAVQGDGCVLLEGKLRARAGAGCALVAADADAVGIQW